MTSSITIAAGFFCSFLATSCATNFTPLPPPAMPPAVARRARLDNFATYADHPDLLVGKILFVTKKNGQCPTDRVFDADGLSIESYLRAGAKVEVKSKSTIVYQGAIKKGADLDTAIATFNLKLNGTVAAEIIVTDVREAIGESQLDLEKIARLERQRPDATVCARILVKNVVISLLNLKAYTEATNSNSFTGTAFGFGTNAYESSSQFQPDFIVGMDIKILKSGVLGAEPEILAPQVIHLSAVGLQAM